MIEEYILSRIPSEEEKNISDIINDLLGVFIFAVKDPCLAHTRMYLDSSNDPNGYRVIFSAHQGFCLVHGDGDRGQGFYIDGKHYSETLDNCSMTYVDNKMVPRFTIKLNAFLDTILTRVFRTGYTSRQFWDNRMVKSRLMGICHTSDDVQAMAALEEALKELGAGM